MTAAVRCQCGWRCTQSREQAVGAMKEHIAEQRPKLVAVPHAADLLAMVEDV